MVTVPSSAAYFAEAQPYLRRNFRIELRAEIVRELIGELRGKRILDLGCGNGAVSLPMASSNEVTLVDNSSAMLSAAHDYAAAHGIVRYSAFESDVCDVNIAPVDLVLALGLLAHVDAIGGVIEAISRNLKTGGSAILQFSDSERPLNKLAHKLFFLRGRRYQRTPRRQVLEAAANHGLHLVDERSHLLVMPGMPRLMGARLLGYDRFVRRHPHMAAHGLDTILLLVKR